MSDGDRHRASLSATRLAGAVLGGALVGYAGKRQGQLGAMSRLLGAGLVFSSLAPSLSRSVVRAGAARRSVRLRTTLLVDRPVREVFAFCHDFENFPRVVHSLSQVIDYQDGRSHWEVLSPSGDVMAWDAVVTKYVPNVVIAWRSVPGSVVDFAGVLRFAPFGGNRTRVAVDICYDPCHTGFHDAVSALVHARRQDELRQDLSRASGYLHAAPPPRLAEETPEEAPTEPLTA